MLFQKKQYNILSLYNQLLQNMKIIFIKLTFNVFKFISKYY